MPHPHEHTHPTEPAATVPGDSNHPLAPIHCDHSADLPRMEVWRLLTTAGGWRRLFQVEARIELRPGGPYEILFDSDAAPGYQGSEGCVVLSFVPEEVLAFTWNAPPHFAHARQQRTWVVVRLDELAPTRTRIRLDHLGFAEQAGENPACRCEWEAVRQYFSQAWVKVLSAIAGQKPQKAD